MKRLATGLFAAFLAIGALAPQAEARHNDDSCYRPSVEYRHDPLFRALHSNSRILLNNFFDGRRYRSARHWISPQEVRFMGRSWGGSYRVWFRGQFHDAYTRPYRGKLCLYIGSAPTGPGYRFELVLG